VLREEQVERLSEASAVDGGYPYRFIREVQRVWRQAALW
jgi:hypothetical protein